jgi:hypothetical protein
VQAVLFAGLKVYQLLKTTAPAVGAQPGYGGAAELASEKLARQQSRERAAAKLAELERKLQLQAAEGVPPQTVRLLGCRF